MEVVLVVAFSSLARILGECLAIHSPSAFLLLLLFFKVAISSRTLIPLFRLESVQAETTVGERSLTSCV